MCNLNFEWELCLLLTRKTILRCNGQTIFENLVVRQIFWLPGKGGSVFSSTILWPSILLGMQIPFILLFYCLSYTPIGKAHRDNAKESDLKVRLFQLTNYSYVDFDLVGCDLPFPMCHK
jgi:hypothetical protein